MQMFRHIRKEVFYVLIAACLLVFVVDLFFPWFLTKAWYVRWLGSVPLQGKVLPAPRGYVGPWQVLPGTDEVSFQRFVAAKRSDPAERQGGMSFLPSPLFPTKRLATRSSTWAGIYRSSPPGPARMWASPTRWTPGLGRVGVTPKPSVPAKA